MVHQNDPPVITVIIPAYNHEQYILETLNSIKKQSYTNIEIAIINDGSIDETGKNIEKWMSSNADVIKVTYRSRPNQGVTATLNELVEMSSGEYIVVLASDDYLLSDSILNRYVYLKDHPEKMAVIADAIVVDEKGNEIYKSALSDLRSVNKELYKTDDGIKKEIIRNWAVVGPTLMVRSVLYRSVKYNEKLEFEDRDFYLKLVAENSLGFIDCMVAAYRIHGDNYCFDEKNLYLSSVNKFKSLICNIHRFDLRDKVYFIIPVISSFAGILIRYLQRRVKSSTTKD